MDDDLVLNLAADDFPAPRKSAGAKGGRWTDRLKAKRVTKRKVTHEPASQNTQEVEDHNPRPEKRARTEGAQKPSRPGPQVQSSSGGGAPKTPAAPAKPTQIISSLFTSNPKIAAPKPAPTSKPSTSTKPSNAALDFTTFEGLGLNPLLISHLTNKMGIKRPTGIQRAALPLMLPTPTNAEARDVFLQSQTGSGKTLSFLLPIIQDLLPLSSLSYIDRSIGTLAIIIAPTRELAKQISDVLEALLKMRLRSDEDANGDSENSQRMTRWLVSGLLIGGATRTHEKARLRKGCPILVSTPGRLLDHIQNTASFNVGKCRWLVLDEADQLMDLGFEETITGILKGLDGRRRLALNAIEEGRSTEVGGWDWDRPRRTVLCSATIRESVQKLAGTALVNPLMIKATEMDKDEPDLLVKSSAPETSTSLTPPSQLSQKYVIAPLKLRLVALLALLRTLIAQSSGGTKIIVFLSCTGSVDFHFNLLGGSQMGTDAPEEVVEESDSDEDDEDDEEAAEKRRKRRKLSEDTVESKCALLPDVSIYRLHGSLPTATRQRALRGFAGSKSNGGSNSKRAAEPVSTSSSILLCTSVAARGLDLPLVRAVIQYDLPTEGGPTEYVHRIGRTARAGKGGEAWSIVAPSEAEWAKWVVDKMEGEEGADGSSANNKKISLEPVPFETVLQNGYGGKGKEYEMRATEVQLAFERWVLRNPENATLARKAYLSHMRAYATHPSNEKHMFHIRHLHLGHLAKSFALREAPTKVNAARTAKSKAPHPASKKRDSKSASVPKGKSSSKQKAQYDSDSDDGDAEKRMKAMVRAQGRLSRKGGAMMRTDTSEFQIMGGDYLEKLVKGQ
ncbi:ATP-dependent RNA helicase DBP7 [Ephemerocybe angulata]|uniref:ATP-dependent RNA helicase n=1 Tax=Ephemerocybe angulata TaxID=980116 RepID=A0A8H6ICS2_9AGAR|nr:ATP-dependent RNA helicase DBP7 [Tulosesus angulatus]